MKNNMNKLKFNSRQECSNSGCTNQARWNIAGKFYCGFHASQTEEYRRKFLNSSELVSKDILTTIPNTVSKPDLNKIFNDALRAVNKGKTHDQIQ